MKHAKFGYGTILRTEGAGDDMKITVSFISHGLKKMIAKLMESLENEENTSKVSIGELLKLLQVYKELTAEQVKEVEVRWVDRLHQDDSPGT